MKTRQGGIGLDKKRIERLKKVEFRNVEYSIFDAIRGQVSEGDYRLYGTTIATLAILNKMTDTLDELNIIVGETFRNDQVESFLNKVTKQYYELIVKVSQNVDEEALQALVLYSEPLRFTRVDEGSTPEGLSKLAVKLLDIKVDDIVLDMGSGVNSYLSHVQQYTDCRNLYGVEINTNNIVIASLRNYVLGNHATIIQGNVISESYSLLNANKVFSNMPLGMRLPDYKNSLKSNLELGVIFEKAKRTVSGDWINCMAAYQNMKKGGKTVALIANAGLWNSSDMWLRRELIEKGVIESVIQLPERLLSNTAIPLTALILSENNENVRMVDASNIFTKERRQNILEDKDVDKIIEAYKMDQVISKEICKEEIFNKEYILIPNRYLEHENEITNGINLGDVCKSINRGAMIKSKDLNDISSRTKTSINYLMLQNIKDGIIDSELPYLNNLDEKLSKYCVKDKNLIISKISPFKIATAHVGEGSTLLANGNLYFLDVDESKINPVYLEAFLQSELGLDQLNRFAKGAAMRSISIKDLKAIQIPNISVEEQNKIAEEYSMLSEQLIIMQKQIEIVRDKKNRLIEGVM